MLHQAAGQRSVNLICLPSSDALFSSLAGQAAQAMDGAPESLEQALRLLFPEVRVQVQDALAAMGPTPIWYVIREPLNQRPPERDGSAPTSIGRAILDDVATFVDADGPVGLLAGVARSELIGRNWRDLHPRSVQCWFDPMIALLNKHGVLRTRWLVAGGTNRPRLVGFRLVKDGAGDHQHAVTLRDLTVDRACGTWLGR